MRTFKLTDVCFLVLKCVLYCITIARTDRALTFKVHIYIVPLLDLYSMSTHYLKNRLLLKRPWRDALHDAALVNQQMSLSTVYTAIQQSGDEDY